MSMVIVILVLVVLALFFFVALYNKLVKNRNLSEEAWSGIDVQLKKRANLIPNLMEVVKGYMGHEREVLENVTKYRSMSSKAGDLTQKAQAESLLGQALGHLFAVAENYPDLKANQNFLELQNALSDVEQSIEMARRYYNGTARNLNIAIESFPSNFVASMFHFQKAEYFEIEDPGDRAVPKISF